LSLIFFQHSANLHAVLPGHHQVADNERWHILQRHCTPSSPSLAKQCDNRESTPFQMLTQIGVVLEEVTTGRGSTCSRTTPICGALRKELTPGYRIFLLKMEKKGTVGVEGCANAHYQRLDDARKNGMRFALC